jgi:CheY-like chemotaxis protein
MSKQPTAPKDPMLEIESLKEALASEKHAREAAQALATAKSDLLATVSHEVRTPMGAIISMAELLRATDLDETQRHYAETLQHSGRGLLAILNDILDFSKLEAGKYELQPGPFDFRQLLAGVGEALRVRAEERELTSSLEIAADCPAVVIGDQLRIRQLLSNLYDNAIKFTEAGSVTIRVSRVHEAPGLLLRFDVIDTGIGLTAKQQERLFEPYTQADRSISLKYGGTGLGLSIARRLAEAMGGRLECRSSEGAGSTFSLWVPLKEADEDALAQTKGARGESSANALKGRVLIVEDNTTNQMLIAAYLDKFGLSHAMAANGREALEMLGQGAYDLVLMDVMMPEMDGLEATRQIRAHEGGHARIPIVALTANAMAGDRETYLEAGMDGYVSKPINANDLFFAMAEHLQCGFQATGTD